MRGCDVTFTTTHYLVTTCPRDEYEIATGSREPPPPGVGARCERRVRPLGELMKEPLTEVARLRREEVTAVVSQRGSNRCTAIT